MPAPVISILFAFAIVAVIVTAAIISVAVSIVSVPIFQALLVVMGVIVVVYRSSRHLRMHLSALGMPPAACRVRVRRMPPLRVAVACLCPQLPLPQRHALVQRAPEPTWEADPECDTYC